MNYDSPAWPYPTARATDPDTSHAAASAPKLKSIRARLFRFVADSFQAGTHTNGWTGHEFAAALGVPLNSLTPRLAELRKAGTIKDSGNRRDGQIIWVCA